MTKLVVQGQRVRHAACRMPHATASWRQPAQRPPLAVPKTRRLFHRQLGWWSSPQHVSVVLHSSSKAENNKPLSLPLWPFFCYSALKEGNETTCPACGREVGTSGRGARAVRQLLASWDSFFIPYRSSAGASHYCQMWPPLQSRPADCCRLCWGSLASLQQPADPLSH